MEGRASGNRPSWFATLLGVLVLVSTGFAFGLIAGVVSQEPELVMGHVQGRGESVPWTEESETNAARKNDAAAEIELARRDADGEATTARRPAPGGSTGLPPVGSPGPKPASEARPSEKVRFAEAAASATAPRSNPPPAPQPAGRYAVQVGAFADSEGADRVAARLGQKGYPVYVTPGARAGDGRWRVRVGPVADRARADQVAARLKHEEQLPTWVLAEGAR